ncbi:MAG: ComF family protein, partial [Bacteroidales bacterium]|nr:ComF family protein [Bacteroidales bacterium]
KQNPAYLQLAGKIPIIKATSYLYYNKEGLGQKIIASIKYKDNISLGQWITRLMTTEIIPSGFFDDFDMIIPVPLHWQKKRKRGYNQTEIIARTISEITGIQLNAQLLYRVKANPTQTKKGIYDRWKNTSGIFSIKDKKLLDNKHVLLIDDVLTTGATLEACAQALLQCEGIRISILTLAIA